MKRRFEGFVVGKQTVRQQKGWKIGRRTRKGRVAYFAPETEIVKGFEMLPSAEVTFSTETRDGRSYALNVQPKTATQMEDSMRNMRFGLITAFVLVIIALVGIFKPHHNENIRGWIVENRAEWALDSIRQLTADQIITDVVVREAVRSAYSLRSSSWAAREAVFWEHQCPIFSIGYEDVFETCYTARYSEGFTEKNVWYEKSGIPVSIAPAIAEMRTELYRIGRDYLITPANMRDVYKAKRDVIINEYHQLSDEDKQAFLDTLAVAIVSFEQFRDDESARVKYAHSIRLENEWREYEGDCCDVFWAWRDSERDLTKHVINLRLYQFAGRRHREGGDELILVYIEIMKDLSSQLNG